MKVLVLHAYSATNAGDGLLVEETIELLREALPNPAITVAALHPDTFTLPGVTVLDASPSLRGFSNGFKEALRVLGDYDLIVGVGGGYIRAGHPVEAIKMAATHGYQLLRASSTRVPTVYFPQSIGPLRLGTLPLAKVLLKKINKVYLRDDRSVAELGLPNAQRFHDLAIMSAKQIPRESLDVAPVPVLSVRAVRGAVSDPVQRLANHLPTFDGYIQSRGAGNDDTAAMASLGPAETLTRDEFLTGDGPRRVVVAVRLHAALMALNAGHWVIHLAYERKGFGAFDDLGLPDFVFNVNSFDVAHVQSLVTALLTDPDFRRDYDRKLEASRGSARTARSQLLEEIRHQAGVKEIA